ncbi:DUF4091 domain-containing protein [Pseudooceanicola sp. CBS1P-1]|uniref:DUF4091 domain-containing protein n=1 Tax=Pseudooceanicola albus TaxID=2692189 RepID=A0A6L7G506_9RHOB|nr:MULTISPECIES: DUF4091 domain-containing protein [Pseudooceanicola]MBT9385212.1 DUF4091 domain-containing protein [Pseudooceanicola endophyticus]MXN18496.1 DUF4091 domain-containing protein [Pseudooceanicola albus]
MPPKPHPAPERTAWQVLLCDSLEKVFPDTAPRPMSPASELAGWPGARVSVQLAVRAPSVPMGRVVPPPPEGLVPWVHLVAQAPEGIAIAASAVDLVPARFLAFEQHDEGYLRDTAGLWPDVLRPLAPGEGVKCYPGQWQSVWIDLEIAADAPCGPTPVTLALCLADGTEVARHSLNLDIRAVRPAPLGIVNTIWMHCDGIARQSGSEPFSAPFMALAESCMAAARDLGCNALLVPVWTPPLDTEVGAERMPTQLVIIREPSPGRYAFDFSRLEDWLARMRCLGFTHLELPHLFTQWGAEATPAIYVEGQRRFGWDVAATDPAYRHFLEQFLPALRDVLERHWGLAHCLFHISDEPEAHMAQAFGAARAVVEDLLEGCTIIDAMSDIALYDQGLVTTPVVSTDHGQDFLDRGIADFWLYYCVAQHRDVANRFFATPPARNRVLGTQLWLTGAKGFLHWGLNFWNTAHSKRPVDPFREPDAGGAFPAGDPFVIYPGPDNCAWHSIRGRVVAEAFADLQLMQSLEALVGRDAVRQIVDPEEALTLTSYPMDPDHYHRQRATLVRALEVAEVQSRS